VSTEAKDEYCGLEGGHLGHPWQREDRPGEVFACNGYPPSQADAAARETLAGLEKRYQDQATAGHIPIAAVEVSEWWFSLRHGSPELNCPNTGKAWALQGVVLGGLVSLPPIMMCVSCGTALTLVDNGPTPPAGEDVNPEGAGSGAGV
jgi:hypothetical protein